MTFEVDLINIFNSIPCYKSGMLHSMKASTFYVPQFLGDICPLLLTMPNTFNNIGLK